MEEDRPRCSESHLAVRNVPKQGGTWRATCPGTVQQDGNVSTSPHGHLNSHSSRHATIMRLDHAYKLIEGYLYKITGGGHGNDLDRERKGRLRQDHGVA